MKRILRYAVSLATVIALLALPATSVAGGGGYHPPKPPAAKPTIVLVHGAWADSGSWDAVTGRLQQAGYTVYVPPNPLRGLVSDTETIRDFIGTISGPIVLVGHSYGGAVITDAAFGDDQVRALVYVDAYIPDEGQTLLELTGPESCFAVEDLSTLLNFVPFPGAAPGASDAYVKQSVFPGCFANGLPAAQGKVLAATQRPLATNALGEKSTAPAWKTIPAWAVVGTADRAIPATDQLAMAKHAGARVTEINAPHLSMIADPGTVTRVIVRAAKATD
jgi:pimeloyl-ACP methyl ester carboxylesterase